MAPLPIAVIDYGVGNLFSLGAALEAVGARWHLVDAGEPGAATRLAEADGLLLPGVGAFAPAMERLLESGVAGGLLRLAGEGMPILGICLGFQLLFEGSEEGAPDPAHPLPGLGLLPGIVRRLPPGDPVPHVGWNAVFWEGEPPAPLRGARPGEPFYFVHAYAAGVEGAGAGPGPDGLRLAWAEYNGFRMAAVAARGNLWGSQFHPEKSGAAGLAFLGRFAGRCGC
ncbi:MAG: imidazole glycerol phosphate synthase subunit HisH [Bacillota bacterium]|nr:imidazole glycerol phosphate synthase subunit HisH [Bacillota bacterium]